MFGEFYYSTLDFVKIATQFIAERSKQIAGPTISKLTEDSAEKIKDLYQNHKELVITVSAATAVYLLMRQKTPKKQKIDFDMASRKKTVKKSMIKSFISEHSESEEEDPTVETKNEWSVEHRKVQSEQFYSEEEEEEEQPTDKIFFEMYRGYQESEK